MMKSTSRRLVRPPLCTHAVDARAQSGMDRARDWRSRLRRRIIGWVVLLLIGNASAALANELAIAAIDNQSGAIGAHTVVKTWDRPTPFTRVQTYTVDGDVYVALLDERTGTLEIYALDGGDLGPLHSYYQLDHRFTSMEIVVSAGTPFLVLHDLNGGRIHTYGLNGGALGNGTSSTSASWKDKDVFETFSVGSDGFFFGYDRFKGDGRVHRANGELVATFDWSQGWSDSDYLTLPSGTHRALYKWADHPGNQGGWLKIDKVDSSFATVSTAYDNSNFAHGYTTVEFVRTLVPGLGGPTSKHFLWLYEAATGAYFMRPFNGTTLSAASASGTIAAKWSAADDYVDAGQAYVILLQASDVSPLTSTQVDQYAASVFADLDSATPGYQALLNQNGERLVSVTGGYVNVANQTPMTVDSYSNVGSVGKIFTTATLLRLVEDGVLDLDQPVIDYLPYSHTDVNYDFAQIPADIRHLTLRELVTQTSGLLHDNCLPRTSPNDSIDCSNVLYALRRIDRCTPGADIAPDRDCFWTYQNANFEVLREVLEQFTGTHTVASIDDLAHRLWADRSGLTAATCLDPPGDAAYYFAQNSCGPWSGNELITTDSCAGGGWYLPARELVRLLEDAKTEQILGPELTQWWMDTYLRGPRGDYVAPGWDPSWTSNICKDGALNSVIGSLSAKACVMNQGEAEAIVLMNTSSTCDMQQNTTDIINAAWAAKDN